MADHAHRGETALSSGDFTAAADHYSLALSTQPEAVNYYIKRSTAYQRSSKFDLALADAEKAVNLATKRAKRELIAQAQLRRGIALFQLGQYANAKFCLQKAKKLNDKEKNVDMWTFQCDSKLKSLSEEKQKVTVAEVPDVVIEKPAKSETKKGSEGGASADSAPAATAATPAPPQTAREKIRHEWYQSNETVTINLLAKGVPKDQTAVEIQDRSVSVSFPLQTGSIYDFSLEPLFAPVNTAESKFRVLSTKIEITLKKRTASQKWANLEGVEEPAASQAETGDDASTKAAAATGPAYPTSSRSGPKNWDKIAQSYQKPPAKSKKDEEEDDMYVDDYEDGDPANAFFKKLYAGADPDTRRAMMKSYQESGGTALSTDWGEVKKKKMEVSPPDGMEEKKWEY